MPNLDPAIFRGFTGVNNLLNPWELEPHELVKCTNYAITKKGKLVSRAGRTLKLTGGYKNLWTNGSLILANRNGALVSVNPEFTAYTTLRSGIGTGYISFADCHDIVAWSNGTSIEYVRRGVSATFPTPTDFGRYPLPAGQLLEYWKGCLWIADGGTAWQSDPFATAFGSLTKPGFSREFADDVTLLKGVDDGMWFSDASGIYFAAGKGIDDMVDLAKRADYPAIKGMFCQVDGKLLPEPMQGTVWAVGTERGICMLGNSGQFQNATEKHISMLSGTSGAMVFHKGSGLNQIISVVG